jgi:hypothetical protein
MEGNLRLDYEPEWNIMRYLVPEVFDSIRDELFIYLDALPLLGCLAFHRRGDRRFGGTIIG